MTVRCLWTGLSSAAVVLALVVGTNVQAQSTSAANSGDWSDPLNWTAGVPVAGTWAAINGSHTINVTPGALVGLLDVGATGTGNLTVSPGADLTAGPNAGIRVGQAGAATGVVTMTGGTVLADGVLDSGLVNGDILIGDNGKGTWTMSDGTVTADDEILIGSFSGTGDGALNVGGGSVNVGRNLVVGLFGAKGALDVSGGVVNVNRDLLSSIGGGVPSTLTQSGGTINVGQHFIHGLAGPSTYTQTGGTVNVTGLNSRLTVAENNSSASWDLLDGSVTSKHIFLGDFDNSHGTMTVSGGSITLSGNLNVGAALASNAPATPTGTQGQALNADGTLIIRGSGGTIDVAGNLLANPDDNTRFGGGGEHNDSTLIFEILDDSGVSTIDVAGIANLNGAEIIVNLLGGSFAPGATFDLISAASFNDDFLSVTGNAGVFNLAVVDSGNGQVLRATLVPEPTSIALWAVAVLACSVCRKSNWRVVARK